MIEERKLAWEKTKFAITALGGTLLFLIGLWQFSITSRNDFAKPIIKKQLDLCIEASGAAAILAEDVRSGRNPGENAKAIDYRSLYFGRLGVVEDRCVYRTMVNFKTFVLDTQISKDDVEKVEKASRLALTIGFACRRMLSKGWNAGLVKAYDPINLLETFTDLDDYRNTMNQIAECQQ
jgi:hypothetical protein